MPADRELDSSMTEAEVVEELAPEIRSWAHAWRMLMEFDDAHQEVRLGVIMAWRKGRRCVSHIGRFAQSRLIDVVREQRGRKGHPSEAKTKINFGASLDEYMNEQTADGLRAPARVPKDLIEPDFADDVIQAEVDRHDFRRVFWAIERLAERTSKRGMAMRLYCIEGKTGPEIAETLGIKVETVHTHLKQARDRIRHTLEKEASRDRQ